ncbi:MAG: hypothetical protein E7Z72_06185 [Methanocorpusculum parvum]|nr:hypothetical protein [Methanocorpusculum parvum]
MAVQKKSNAGDKPEEKKTNWMQIGVIAFCVLMVVMCVLSFANFQNFFGGSGSAGPAEEGNPVLVQYKMYVGGKAVFETIGGFIAGYETDKDIYIPIESSEKPYLVFKDEQNAISAEVIGMNQGETKTVDGSGGQTFYFTKEAAEKGGIDFEKAAVGDIVGYNENYEDELGEEAQAFRKAVITEKTDEGLTVQYGTDKIEMKFVSYLQIS